MQDVHGYNTVNLYLRLRQCMQVQGGKPKARRVLLSEDSISMSTTDSEADSMLADSGAAKRKPGAKKGAALCLNCRKVHLMLALQYRHVLQLYKQGQGPNIIFT